MRVTALLGVLLLALYGCSDPPTEVPTASAPSLPPTPDAPPAGCGPDSQPEGETQGRVMPGHKTGYWCNAKLVGSYETANDVGTLGGYKVERYIDKKGQECAFYDTTLAFPTNVFGAEAGVNVMKVTRDASGNPSFTRTFVLATPAMLSPHETLVMDHGRGLLVAVSSTLATAPGIVDIHDASADCTRPLPVTSAPVGLLGHESGLSPDGTTFYAASFYSPDQTDQLGFLTAVDISTPQTPKPLARLNIRSHGLTISDDGTRAYVAGAGRSKGLVILDTSKVRAGEITVIKHFDWRPLGEPMSTPQNVIPITVKGHPYLLAFDEFGAQSEVGGVHVIDIADEQNPQIVANIRLEVHNKENFEAQKNDPGATTPFQGYANHYCNVPRRDDPEIVACTMILSGLRVFDIRNPKQPREVAYFNAPIGNRHTSSEFEASNWAMSSPAFAPEHREIWYTDAFNGFYAVRLPKHVWDPGPNS